MRFLVQYRLPLPVLDPVIKHPELKLVDGEVRSVDVNADCRGGKVTLSDGSVLGVSDLVVQRGGLDLSTEQQIALDSSDIGRIELGRIPPPVVTVTPVKYELGRKVTLPVALSAAKAA